MTFFEIGQQKINFSLYKLELPSTDLVYTLKKVIEESDYSGLLSRAVDRIVELCGRALAFI